ncbi:UBX domain-containing protein 6 [Planococcus citri]|uniref:UBX domain-containing protein 6 n=1 Tax=Planococcus citri TaxID=170843 RepID=UPI0031F7B85E
MAENIKKFFKKTKVDLKFKKAGPGQRLNEETKKPSPRAEEPSFSRVEPTAEAKQAAAAALARIQNTSGPAGFNKSSLYSKAKSEVAKEIRSSEATASNSGDKTSNVPTKSEEEDLSHFAASGVYFRCPLISEEILSKTEWKTKIKTYLYEQLETEKGLIACVIIRNCNKNPDKIAMCVDTLNKYLRNIVSNPVEEKFRKIRLSNKVFQDKVAGMEGAMEFLEAAGFVKESLTVNDELEEFLVMPAEKSADIDMLESLMDALNTAETFTLELDRNVRILLPSQAERQTKLPDDFFRYTPEELKKEQQARSESVDSMLILRTKAMREKHEQKEMKKYRYALIRIRFPDGILLQGTFSVHEKFEEVNKFVEENLSRDCEFSLVIADVGKNFVEEDFDKTLLELRLVPAAVLLFHSDNFSSSEEPVLSYLKPDVAILLQNI